MAWSGILGKTAAGLGAAAVPVVFAVAGAGQASAAPGVCVSGPWGLRIRMHQRARMGRLESGTQLGPARTGQECMVPREPARSLEGWSTRHPLYLMSLEFSRK